MKKNTRYGVILSAAVESVFPNIPFNDKKDKKSLLNIMAGLKSDAVTVLCYAVYRNGANMILASSSESLIQSYLTDAALAYSRHYSDRYKYQGTVLKMPVKTQKLKPADLPAALGFIHLLPEKEGDTDDYKKYAFSSCRSFMKGTNPLTDKAALLELTGLTKLDGITYSSWHQNSEGKKVQTPSAQKEKFDDVVKDLQFKYASKETLKEDILKWYFVELNKRTGRPYDYIAKKLGVPLKQRKDILVEVIWTVCQTQKLSFLQAFNRLQLEKVSPFTLLSEVIITVSLRHGFSYDYIVNELKVDDSYGEILTAIVKLMNKDLGYSFTQIATNLHLQNKREVLLTVLESMCFTDNIPYENALALINMPRSEENTVDLIVSVCLKNRADFFSVVSALGLSGDSSLAVSAVRNVMIKQNLALPQSAAFLGLSHLVDELAQII